MAIIRRHYTDYLSNVSTSASITSSRFEHVELVARQVARVGKQRRKPVGLLPVPRYRDLRNGRNVKHSDLSQETLVVGSFSSPQNTYLSMTS